MQNNLRTVPSKLATYFKKAPTTTDAKNRTPAAATAMYYENIAGIDAICKQQNIRCIFVLQPLIFTKKNPTPAEQELMTRTYYKDLVAFGQEFYKEVKADSRFTQYAVVDATTAFDDNPKQNFFDFGHLEPRSSAIVGEFLSEKLLRVLR